MAEHALRTWEGTWLESWGSSKVYVPNLRISTIALKALPLALPAADHRKAAEAYVSSL